MNCTNACVQPSPSNAHCASCHLTFGSVRGFDLHRRGGGCRYPGNLRMHLDAGGRWRMDGWTPDAHAPAAPAVEPQAAENGSGVGPGTLGVPEAAETIPWGDYPLQETYPGSGIYE
jgi:hypothetical protein